MRQPGIDLVVRAEPTHVAHADGARIAQVLHNLIGNALKFTPVGGRVCIEVEEVQESLRPCVRDTGRGVTPEQAERLFQPFSQAHQELAAKGSGLGLYVCKGIIEQHGGRIRVEREGPERGAAFCFTIPAENEGQP